MKKNNLGTVTLSDTTVVEIAKPTLLQVRAVQKIKDETEQEVEMVASITGISKEKLDALFYDDYVLLANEANSFLYRVGKMREKALA